MAIEFGCPVCGGTLRAEDDATGQVVRCGGCLSMLRVPAAPAEGSFPAQPDSPFPGSPEIPSEPVRPRASPRDLPAPPVKPRLTEIPSPPGEGLPPRRRPVEPPPPRGRNPLFWVMAALGVFALGSCMVCCGVVSFVSGTTWQVHTSAKGGFRVDLPGKERDHLSVRGLNMNASYQVEGSRVWARGEFYAVYYKEIEPSAEGKRKSNDVIFDLAVKDLEAAGIKPNKKAGFNRLDLDGFPARDYLFANSAGSYVVRIIIVDKRLFILIAGGKTMQQNDENAVRFLHSFAIIDDNLIKDSERAEVAEIGKALGEMPFQGLRPERKHNDEANDIEEIASQTASVLEDAIQRVLARTRIR